MCSTLYICSSLALIIAIGCQPVGALDCINSSLPQNCSTSEDAKNDSLPACPTGYLALNKNEFELAGNGTVLYNDEPVEVLLYDSQDRPLVCLGNTTQGEMGGNRTFLPALAELTYAGSTLSVLGTTFILLTYSLFSELRTFPSLLLMNLSFALLVTNIFLILGGPIIEFFPRIDLCTVGAIFLHYLYLVQFAWMSLFSLKMTHTFYLARNMVTTSDKREIKKHVLLVYMLIGWCFPLVITAVAVGLNFSGTGLVLYGVRSDGGLGNCWINHYLSFILFFLSPFLVAIVIDTSMFITVTILLCQASQTQRKMQHSSFILLRVWIAFLSTTSLCWVFGFLAISDEFDWAWYPFVLFNSTQGFSIFLAFLFSKKTLRLYAGLLTGKRKKSALGHTSSSRQRRDTTRSQALASGSGTSQLRLTTTPSQESLV